MATRQSGDRSHAVEDYLKAIRHLQMESSPVSTSALAQLLERSPASVTNMIKSLAERGCGSSGGTG
jgi:DtxR family Mn-dependent transcriptional regulator